MPENHVNLDDPPNHLNKTLLCWFIKLPPDAQIKIIKRQILLKENLEKLPKELQHIHYSLLSNPELQKLAKFYLTWYRYIELLNRILHQISNS